MKGALVRNSELLRLFNLKTSLYTSVIGLNSEKTYLFSVLIYSVGMVKIIDPD